METNTVETLNNHIENPVVEYFAHYNSDFYSVVYGELINFLKEFELKTGKDFIFLRLNVTEQGSMNGLNKRMRSIAFKKNGYRIYSTENIPDNVHCSTFRAKDFPSFEDAQQNHIIAAIMGLRAPHQNKFYHSHLTFSEWPLTSRTQLTNFEILVKNELEKKRIRQEMHEKIIALIGEEETRCGCFQIAQAIKGMERPPREKCWLKNLKGEVKYAFFSDQDYLELTDEESKNLLFYLERKELVHSWEKWTQ